MDERFDVVVIGGGPGGSATAALTAEAGLSTLLVERESVPRFHVGESLMPEVYWPLQRLGLLERMKESDFVKKMSVQFVSHSGKESQPFFFKEHDPRECSQTWQVERGPFDEMLFRNAAEKGAVTRDQTRVLDIVMDGQRVNGVTLRDQNGNNSTVQSNVVVDATGQSALIANRLGIRDEDPHLRKAAIWTYYHNAARDQGENSGATIIMHTESKEAWFWFIPLREDITSIGVVSNNDYLLKGRGSPSEVFEQELEMCSGMQSRLKDARKTDQHHVAKEFSYTTRRQAGDGWVLVGDAFGFIDPIYSSGVFFALKSGEMAADAIIEAHRQGDYSAGVLSGWVDEFKGATKWIRKLVDAYYTNEFSFGRFLGKYPQYRGDLTNLLIGRIFHDSAGRIFDDMDPQLEQARRDSIA